MNGDSVSLLVQEFFQPLNASLDYLFAAGVAYGATHLLRFAWRCARGVRTYLVPFGRYARRDLTKEFGKWAVVTGATSGIGLAYAREFASRGMNVIVINRSYDDLLEVVSEIQSVYAVQAYGIHADYSLGTHVFQEIEEALSGYEIGILVNNVAIHYDHPQYFALVPPQRVWQLLSVNVVATTVMTHMVLPQMLRRGRGAIINVCSTASCTPPIPLSTGYTATAAFVDNFTQGLHYENYSRGITVQILMPCFIARGDVKPSFFVPDAATYVRHAMATLGTSIRTSGYWPHALQSWACTLIPRWLWIWCSSYLSRIKRKQCLSAPRRSINGTRPARLFVRRRQDSVAGPATRQPSVQWLAENGFRRSPSPQRRVPPLDNPLTTSTPVGGASNATRKVSLDPIQRISGEEIGILSPSRSSTGGSGGSRMSTSSFVAIPESPMTPRTPDSPTLPGRGFAGGPFAIVPPRRASSSTSAEPREWRHLLPKRHSRVLVVPSVARVSMSTARSKDREGVSGSGTTAELGSVLQEPPTEQ